MTEHKATAEQWAAIEGTPSACLFSALLELRARVEALEAAAKPAEPDSSLAEEACNAFVQICKANSPTKLENETSTKPDSSLVGRVSDALMESVKDQRSMARAVLLAIAAWLRQRDTRVRASVEIAADIEREANQQPS